MARERWTEKATAAILLYLFDLFDIHHLTSVEVTKRKNRRQLFGTAEEGGFTLDLFLGLFIFSRN